MTKTWLKALVEANKAPRCRAETRRKTPCQSPSMLNGRCRMHGGKSPGAPCGEKHGQYKHGLYTKQATVKRLAVRTLVNQAQHFRKKVEGLIA